MKIKVIMKIALMVLIVTMITSSIAYAANPNFVMTEIDSHEDSELSEPIAEAAGAILNAIRIIGTGIALVMIAVVAMKYMLAAPGDRADLKKSSIQYVVGALLVFGASNLLKILVDVVPGMVPEAS